MSDDDQNVRALAINQAAEWFVRLQEAEVSETEYRRYRHWLDESPANLAEIFRAGRLHVLLKRTLKDA